MILCAGAFSVTVRPSLSIALGADAIVADEAIVADRIIAMPTRMRMRGSYRAKGTLMVQGATSGAGKSTLVAGLCRVLSRRGKSVAPFKPQNMSLNSAVSSDGGEIGRAQALQAQAARVSPLTDMNPVLIKPVSDTRAQIVVNGQPFAEVEAGNYQLLKPELVPHVTAAFDRLRRLFPAVIVEGAGSPAEINLRDHDIANMGFAEAVDCPVVIVADIDRGGVFAHFVGTLACLSESERERVEGFVINRFRGDRGLLEPGIDWLERTTGKPVLGVLGYLPGLKLDAEDALPELSSNKNAQAFKVVVPVYPRISNHTDLDALRYQPGIEVRFLGPGDSMPAADLIVLPGSKNVRADLAFLTVQGWADAVLRHLRYGGKVVGLCGGMQMLGSQIHDPLGIEGEPGSSQGLGALEMQTILSEKKKLRNVRGIAFPGSPRAAAVTGYEIHMGVTNGPALGRPAILLEGSPEGALSADGLIFATYLHGLFDSPAACAAVLEWAGCAPAQHFDLDTLRETSLDRVADEIEAHLELEKLLDYF